MPAPPGSRPIPSELALIAALRAHRGVRGAVRTGIGDDCAILRIPRGHELAVTTDLLLETTHFRRDWHSPEAAGHRCLARGLSDLAATGARPLAAFLSVAIPRHLAGGWTERFFAGLLGLADRVGVPLAGGDTAEAPGGRDALFTADITLIGAVPGGRALLRSGARAGDALYVTGRLGGAAAELAAIRRSPRRSQALRAPGSAGQHPQLFPEPRLLQGLRLRTLASAAIDLSDGLSTDLHHLCAASGVRVELDAAAIPVHGLAQTGTLEEALHAALHGGEDYELLFTARPGTRVPHRIAGVPVTKIGEVRDKARRRETVLLVEQDGSRNPLQRGGWEHFRSTPARSRR